MFELPHIIKPITTLIWLSLFRFQKSLIETNGTRKKQKSGAAGYDGSSLMPAKIIQITSTRLRDDSSSSEEFTDDDQTSLLPPLTKSVGYVQPEGNI